MTRHVDFRGFAAVGKLALAVALALRQLVPRVVRPQRLETRMLPVPPRRVGSGRFPMNNLLAAGTVVTVVLLALAMPRFVAPASAQDQALTVDALDNATYQPLHTEAFGDTVQLVNGIYSGTLFGPDGGIRQGSYVFGDLNGDGADDAVAIVLEQTGCCASSINVILAVYANDGGVPQFADSVSLGAVPRDVTVEGGTITVSGPVVKQFMLQEGKLGAVTQPAAPASTAPELSPLNGFPGAVLVLPLDQPPYASWTFQGVHVNAGPYYNETVGSPDQRIGSDAITIEGSVGGFASGDPHDNFNPICQPATTYCYYPPFGQSSGAEIFNGLKARGMDAFVLHSTFPTEKWSLFWMDRTANTNYELSFDGNDVITMFEPLGTFNKSNVTAAQQLAAMADKLVTWNRS